MEAQDAGADGRFVYAVRSTGVYCRPSCPARRPLRRNVEFFEGPAQAEGAGYRACRRCDPAGTAGDRVAEAVARVCAALAEPDPPAMAELAGRVGFSPSYLRRSFTRLVGSTPRQYAAAARRERARAGLRSGGAVMAAAFGAGYGSSRAFYEEASSALGMAPASYRRGGAGEVVRYTEVASPLGAVLVAATARGVCAVRFLDGSSAGAVLAAELPAAVLVRDDAGLREAAAGVVAAVGAGPHPALPLEVRATAFQLQVWRALQAIPAGRTATYAEVAAAVGRPSAVRAVAAACAANPVAVLVPCHRVVGTGGRLAGYRWGLERKRALLDAEREANGA